MNMKENCQTCTNPTKYPIGFWDGEKSHGKIFNCHNYACIIKQENIEKALAIKEDMDKIDRINLSNEISMKLIKDKRKELLITIMKMSRLLGVSPSTYSNYEQCREPLPIELMERIEDVFKDEYRSRMEERMKEMYP